MSKSQLLLIILSVVLLVALFLGGDIIAPRSPETSLPTQEDSLGFDQFVEERLTNLPAALQDSIRKLINKASESDDNASTSLFVDIARYWVNYGEPAVAAYYFEKNAQIEASDTSWQIAGANYIGALIGEKDITMRELFLGKAASCFQQSLDINPSNNEVKIALATTYMEDRDKIMNGVQMLLDIVRKDSNNINANLILGKWGVFSGQFDKAIKRLEKVVSLDSENLEAYWHLSQAYSAAGDTQKAHDLLARFEELNETRQ